jgi:hypothetical protein
LKKRYYIIMSILVLIAFTSIVIPQEVKVYSESYYVYDAINDNKPRTSTVNLYDCDTDTGWSTTGGDGYRTWGESQSGRVGCAYVETSTTSNYIAYRSVGVLSSGVAEWWLYLRGTDAKEAAIALYDQDMNIMFMLTYRYATIYRTTDSPNTYHSIVTGVSMNTWIRTRVEWDCSDTEDYGCEEDKFHVYLEDENLYPGQGLVMIASNCTNFSDSDETSINRFAFGLVWYTGRQSDFVIDSIRVGDIYDNQDNMQGFGWQVTAANECADGGVNITLWVITYHTGLLHDSWGRITNNESFISYHPGAEKSAVDAQIAATAGNYTWRNTPKLGSDNHFTGSILSNRTGGGNNYTTDATCIINDVKCENATYSSFGFSVWVTGYNHDNDKMMYYLDLIMGETIWVENGQMSFVTEPGEASVIIAGASRKSSATYRTLGSVQTFIRLLEKWYGDNWWTVWSTCVGGAVTTAAFANRKFRVKMKRHYYNLIDFIGTNRKKRLQFLKKK